MRARLIKWLGGVSEDEYDLILSQLIEMTKERDVYQRQYAEILELLSQTQFLKDQIKYLQDLIFKEHGLIHDNYGNQQVASQQPLSRAPVSWMRAKRAMEKADVDSMRKEDAASQG